MTPASNFSASRGFLGRFAVAAVVSLAFAPSAFAWRHLGSMWLPEDFPLAYYVADDEIEDDIPWQMSQNPDADCEETVPSGYCKESMLLAMDQWNNEVPCSDVDLYDGGVIANQGFTSTNFKNYITFNDPENEIEEVATLAVTLPLGIGTAAIIQGTVYKHMYDADLIFNEDSVFDTHYNIEAGNCNGGTNIRAVMTHEMGHSLGLGHSCEQFESCTDPLLRDATMEWSEGSCNVDAQSINQDDIDGISVLYGPYATFECSHSVSDELSQGNVPFDLKCSLDSKYLAEVTAAEWNFGDGGTSSDLSPTHTYSEPGNYTIQLTVNGAREDCGADGWEYKFRRVGYVRACDVPEASFHVEHVDGLTYKLVNESDVSVYGCIDDVQWDIFSGAAASGSTTVPAVKAWEPEITLPEEGEYTVVLNLGGPAGTGAAKVTFEAKDRSGQGRCATGVGDGLGLLPLSFALVALSRRRKR